MTSNSVLGGSEDQEQGLENRVESPEHDQTGVMKACFQAVVQWREKGDGWQSYWGRSEGGLNENLGFLIWVIKLTGT